MNSESTPLSIGQKIERVRIFLGIKQETVAGALGITQQAYSHIEKQTTIDDSLLGQIAEAMGMTPDVIKNFDLERAVYNINHNNYQDATISEGATTYAIAQLVNPIEKIVELYERLLKSEREKSEILMNKK